MMARSATDVMQDVINAAVVDAIVALKDASAGLPNALLRDLNAIHANTAFADLPAPIRNAVSESVRTAFARLRSGGYVVADTSVKGVGVRHAHSPGSTGGRGRGRGPPAR